jgi:hypothetical protein
MFLQLLLLLLLPLSFLLSSRRDLLLSLPLLLPFSSTQLQKPVISTGGSRRSGEPPAF